MTAGIPSRFADSRGCRTAICGRIARFFSKEGQEP